MSIRSIPPMQFETRIERACAAVGKGIESAMTDSKAMKGLIRRSFIDRRILINQDAQGCTIQIFKLAATKRPEKGAKAQQAEPESNRDEEGDPRHFAAPFRRRALATTITDEPDMASAAISGVTMPMIAMGTAITL